LAAGGLNIGQEVELALLTSLLKGCDRRLAVNTEGVSTNNAFAAGARVAPGERSTLLHC
jgi:hypothetical protein